ncbi:lysozyme family protein [Streptococcus macacae]|uniref:Pneumococcal vaccine antigen A family protein n=1 Tax=Streptococcus macacae NCTC 11558 TaxID=764298 RepID=G5JUD1_9STRE|nr:lysozyme family protein [Streptococcus macacae]EHJ51566.1 pneumococcal vaccine antigen A family protein [Streptococcus macacae NCTC 11558]SUN78494.1 transposon-like protein [Streptococcus macacae NCTC 11558]
MKKKIISIVLLALLIFIAYRTFTTYQNVKNVLSYRTMVREVLDENDTTANENLVLAMIYTETKGQEEDLMQSSESSSGVKNTIRDSRESVRQGITVLSDNLEEAQKKKTDVWSAVQAYNFGKNYIGFISKNGGKNTIKLAKRYSKNVVAPSLGNKTGKTYRYFNAVALFYGGGELYKNGGNIYYAKQVSLNLLLIQFVSKFQR